MGKFFLFSLLWMITGNPILAIIVILAIYYFIDRRYIGLLPSVTKPFRRMLRASNLKQQIAVNPHDMPAKYDLATTYMERHHFQQGLKLLDELPDYMQETAEVIYDRGLCYLAIGKTEEAEKLIQAAINVDSTLRYGEPYLKLATAKAASEPDKALELLEEFQTYNFSSCESYYRMAQLQRELGHTSQARQSLRQCLETYRMLPRFRKRAERRWAVLAQLKMMLGG